MEIPGIMTPYTTAVFILSITLLYSYFLKYVIFNAKYLFCPPSWIFAILAT